MTKQRVICTECAFERVVAPDDEKDASEYVIEHGREMGHTLRVETMEEGDG